MTQFTPFGFPPIDPSKMDPKVLMQLSQLIQSLPPEQLNRMQTLMHNMMAGHDVRKEMEEFEKSLPPGFREKLMSIMASAPIETSSTPVPSSQEQNSEMDLKEARLTILRAVAAGQISPEEAEKLIFNI